MENVLFTAARAAFAALAVLSLWWIVSAAFTQNNGKRLNFFGMIGAVIRRMFVVVGVIALIAVAGGTMFFGAIYVIPRLSLMMDKKSDKKIDRSPIRLVTDSAVAAEPETPERPSAPTSVPHPVEKLAAKGVRNTPMFEVLAREGMQIVFFRKDGSKTGSIIRVIGDPQRTLLAIPVESDSYAMVFPVRHETDCQYQTKDSNGKFVPCKKHGPEKFGMEDWGVRYAYFDSQ